MIHLLLYAMIFYRQLIDENCVIYIIKIMGLTSKVQFHFIEVIEFIVYHSFVTCWHEEVEVIAYFFNTKSLSTRIIYFGCCGETFFGELFPSLSNSWLMLNCRALGLLINCRTGDSDKKRVTDPGIKTDQILNIRISDTSSTLHLLLPRSLLTTGPV